MALMAFLGYAMMAGMVVSPGVNCQISLTDIKAQTEKAKDHYDSLEKQWNAVFQQETVLNDKITGDILDQFDKMNTCIAQANQSHRAFVNSTKQVQYMGIIMVTFIFFLLLMRELDMFDTIQDIIMSPFRSKKV
jgi:hypothetical protein